MCPPGSAVVGWLGVFGRSVLSMTGLPTVPFRFCFEIVEGRSNPQQQQQQPISAITLLYLFLSLLVLLPWTVDQQMLQLTQWVWEGWKGWIVYEVFSR